MAKPILSSKKRLMVVFGFILLLALLLVGRLAYWQLVMGEELQKKALTQWTRDTELTAARGRIIDSTGIVLAQSGTTYKILVWPNQRIDKSERERIATELSDILEMDYATVLKKVNDFSKGEIVLARCVERDVVDQITDRQLGSSIGIAIDTKRYYPSGSLFSQLLGFTTIDSDGQDGLELKYDRYLGGEDGRMISETDNSGDALAYGVQEIIEPEDGCDLILTTNSVVQSILEKALKEALEINNAETAQGIVMDCKTGAILAISTQPDYDPNDPPRSDLELLQSLSRNRIVADSYEPGSTFKIITLAAALDSKAVSLDDEFDCPGYHVVNGEKIKCWKSGGHGHQMLAKAVQNSCNPVFMRMALAMGRETFYDYIYAFGFGSSTGSGILSESSGIVTHQKYVNDNTLARIGFGQSIAVTPIQLASAVCAAVNGGNLMQPYVVSKIVSADGEEVSVTKPTVIRRVISSETSAMVRQLLEGVVAEGSGKNAQIPGYRVGGKTGTAQKYENGKIADGKLIASFIGFAPADDPEFVCLILVDEPKVGTIFGSTVAAPFVKMVMEETLWHFGYMPEGSDETVTVPNVIGMSIAEAKTALSEIGIGACYQDSETDIITAQTPKAGERVAKGSEILMYTANTCEDVWGSEDIQQVKVPDVFGMTKLQANDALKGYGLILLIDPPDQTGKAIRQSPEAGTMVEPGTEVLVDFSSTSLGD